MIGSHEIISSILIVLGTATIVLSILTARHLLGRLKGKHYMHAWRPLRFVMIFSIAGALAVLSVILVGHNDLLTLLTGIIFVSGALFVYLIVRAGRFTIEELLKTTASKNYVDNVIQSMAEALITVNPDGVIKGVNPAALDLFGYEDSELVGKSVEMIFADIEEASAKQIRIDDLIRRTTVRNVEVTCLAKDGRGVPVSFSGSVIRDGDGVLQEIICVAQDITAYKETEAALTESETRNRLIVDTALDAVITMDAGGSITGWNNQAEITFGWSRQEAIGRLLSATIIPHQYRDAHESGLANCLSTGEGKMLNNRVEVTALHRDGHEFPVELAIVPAKSKGQFIFSAFVRDITDRKRTMEELRQAKATAEAAGLAKSRFLANMSHEMRTPMNGVIGMTGLALDTELTPEQREYLEMVQSSANSLLTLINDILDFSKIEAGKLDLDTIDFNLRDTLGDTMKTLAVQSDAKGLELAYVVAPEVPDALVGDPGRLRQVIINLVGNAVKFTRHGEVVVQVKMESEVEDGVCLHFSVADTGIGIAPEKQHLIFEAFTQADGSTTREFGGTGLGLTISSQLVHMMSGQIWVESDVGEGSTFHFTGQFGLQKGSGANPVPIAPDHIRGLPVLVVGDNATHRNILQKMLRNWQMEPTVSADGQEALTAMAEAQSKGEPFAFVVIDGWMPKMNGFELAERIKGTQGLAETQILMLTSVGQRGDAARCRELGISAYLTKPINEAELLDAIMAMLSTPSAPLDKWRLITRHSLRESRRGLRILVAEDNPVNQKLVIRILEKQGHAVVVAENGKQALDALAKEDFDLVLMDVQMPEMGGFEATAAIRDNERGTNIHLPIVAMTAHATDGAREQCLEAGMDAYLSKPIEVRDLFEVIESLVSTGVRPGPGVQDTVQSSDGIFDQDELLARVGGDMELLREIAGLFRSQAPKLLSRIREAIACGDSEALERTAHSLKGAVGNFAAQTAYDVALRLEEMGRNNDFENAKAGYAELDEAINRLNQRLETLQRENSVNDL